LAATFMLRIRLTVPCARYSDSIFEGTVLAGLHYSPKYSPLAGPGD
jgi:hypothetical protein